MKSKNAYLKMSGLYTFTYLGLGSMMPLLSTYLKEDGLTGIQIGTITSISSLMVILAPPFMGYLSDRFKIHKMLLLLSFILSGGMALILPEFHHYGLLLGLYSIFYFFQANTYSLLDAVALHATLPYGKIRQWGSYGFAVAVLVVGFIVDQTTTKMIFYFYILFMACGVVTISRLIIKLHHEEHSELSAKESPREQNKQQCSEESLSLEYPIHKGSNLVSTLLHHKPFLLFMAYGFFVSGSLGSNNVFFGLHYAAIGGTITGFGVCFFLFAASEAPFMQLAAGWIKRFGIFKVLFLANSIGVIRWVLYALSPPPILVILTFFLQGIFYGPYMVGTAEWLKQYVPQNVRSLGMTFFTAIGLGLGGIFCNYFGGVLMDTFGTYAAYINFTVLSLIGLLLLRPLKILSERTAVKKENTQ